MNQKQFDLEERTAKYGEQIILFCRKINKDSVTNPLISQLVRSGTSIGANYAEANNASSRKDFQNKIFICKKESQETNHWLRMLNISNPEFKKDIETLRDEAHQLTLIFQKITTSLKQGN